MNSSFSLLFLTACILLLVANVWSLHIPLVVHRREDIAEVTIDTVAKGVAFTRPFLLVPEKTPAAVIAIYVNKSILYVHDWSGEKISERRKDEVQVVYTKKIQPSVSYMNRRRISALDDTVTSLAVDWITDKLYFGIEVPVTQTNVGRIEACSLEGLKMCTIVLSSEAVPLKPKVESLHFLVLDPNEGRMYWLNSLNKWIESAWMDGQHHVVNLFNQSLGDNVVTTGLTLDQTSQSLYYLKINSLSSETSLWNCSLVKPFSCRFVAILESGHYLGIFHDYLIWTSLSPQMMSSSLTVCEKIKCSNGSFIKISNSEGFGAFLVNDTFSQPQKYSEVLFVATSSGMLQVSLDTNHHIPVFIEPLQNTDVTFLDYDPIERKIYFVERDSRSIKRYDVTGANLENFVENLSADPEFVVVDWLNRNIYWLNSKVGQIKIQSITNNKSRILFYDTAHSFHSLAVDPNHGFLYFADTITKKNKFSVVRARLDGSNQQNLIDLDYEPSGIAVDGDSDTIYWSDNEKVLLRSAFLNNGSYKNSYNKSDNRPASMSKLGNYLYYITLFGRQIYMLDLAQNGTLPSGEKIDFMNGMMIYSLQNIKAANFDVIPNGTSPCFVSNGGCSHICIKLHYRPEGGRQCLCEEGYELLSDGTTCHLPDAFLVYRYVNRPNLLMRISLNRNLSEKSRLYVGDGTAAIDNLGFDYKKKRVFWSASSSNSNFKFLFSAYYNGSDQKLVLASESIDDISVDWITGNIYWCNTVHQRIEVARWDGLYKRVIVWKNVLPRYLVVNPKNRFIAFINRYGGKSSIYKLSLFGNENGDCGTALHNSSNNVLSNLMLDYFNDKFYWYSQNATVGQLFSMNFDGTELKKWVSTSNFAPIAMSVYKGSVYFMNAGSSAIEVFYNGKFSVLHRDVPKLIWLGIAFRYGSFDDNGCSNNNGDCPELCVSDLKRPKCICETHKMFDERTKKCSGPTQFFFLASKEQILRVNVRNENDTKVFEEPYVVLRIGDVGAPKALDFDIFSLKHFVYWIDAWQDDVVKRASETYSPTKSGLNKPEILNISRDLNCANVSSLAIDNYGRQIYISCVEASMERGSSVHVFRINSDESLKYVGSVVDGKKIQRLVGHRPFPLQIAIFPNLNMLFYVDAGGWEPQLIRCSTDGKTCSLWNTTGLYNSSHLHAFHSADDRIFFTSVNGFHWHLALEHSPRQQPHIYLHNVLDIIPVSNEKVFVLKRLYDTSIISEYPLVEKHIFSEVQYSVPAVLAVSDIFEADGSVTQSYYTCEKSHCSNLCLVHRAKAAEDRFECLCPLGYYKHDNNCSKAVICESWEFTCHNGQQCVHYGFLCDGNSECEDYSDEHPKLCKINNYKISLWPCLNGEKAIQRNQLCDGKKDCADNSDEFHCKCTDPATEFDCILGHTNKFRCIKREKICSHLQNCSNINDDDKDRCQRNDDKFQLKRHSLSLEFAFPFFVFFTVTCFVLTACYHFVSKRRPAANRFATYPVHFNRSVAEAHVLLPVTPTGTQVELQLRTFPTGGSGSAIYNTVPSFKIPSKIEVNGPVCGEPYLPSTPSIQASVFRERDFTAPPPSAASLSTYGVVKPAGMKLHIDSRPCVETSLRRSRRRTKRRRNKQRSLPPPSSPPLYSPRQDPCYKNSHQNMVDLPAYMGGSHITPQNTCTAASSESSTTGESPNKVEMFVYAQSGRIFLKARMYFKKFDDFAVF
uniref:EGF-like domain-containing protein n=1 Tax=Syphacia muris TaxID=451379 RepID=A0A158R5X5_9BILA